VKYLGAFCKGPAYAEMLKIKMKSVEKASQAMNEQASQRKHLRLKEIRNVTVQSMATSPPAESVSLISFFLAKDQVGELKILAVETRNHLYAVFGDSEVWQEALQSMWPCVLSASNLQLNMTGWMESRVAKESRRASRDQAISDQQGELAC